METKPTWTAAHQKLASSLMMFCPQYWLSASDYLRAMGAPADLWRPLVSVEIEILEVAAKQRAMLQAAIDAMEVCDE